MTHSFTQAGPREARSANGLPDWVPAAARIYLAHTEAGLSIRALARSAGCHASTVLRQIRRVETRRDDPLVDAALRTLGAHIDRPGTRRQAEKDATRMSMEPRPTPKAPGGDVSEATLLAEAGRVLRRLCETGAVLAVAADMEKAVIVREGPGGTTRTGVVERATAEALALKDWITAQTAGRITRYTVTPAGRAALEDMLAEESGTAVPGFADAQATFVDRNAWADRGNGDEGRTRRARYNLSESPLTALARRRDKDGAPFLDDAFVRAGERLREDFELAQMGPRVAQNWESFLTGGVRPTQPGAAGGGRGPEAAAARVAAALDDLGPGLADVALRCCCYLEGLETAEKRMGWSARSGKIVLRIALMRLKRHYDETLGPGGPLIG
ncbi:DUF6456 domain-containing protein [Sulfitobacter sp. D35]|uniref:DUF6456 domain-containing protein n=1 Tax=Sulfitobacter sp. D35 TaxID=3083252 RepID=UPI00296F90ED|nr:DUF6456 domain-containing protein [Sulfitobacter sp. D35]MDW4497773.1 DUF6456 domain-containing protein [Sulfitobacter sp. D35]